MSISTCQRRVLSTLTLCALFITTGATASQGTDKQGNSGVDIPILLDCSTESQANLRRLAEGGDPAAQFGLGIEAFFEKCVAEDPKLAKFYLSKSASAHYPPAMHWLAALLQRDEPDNTDRIFALYRDSALLGYRRSELNVAVFYADPASKVHSNADAYAWIKMCVYHDSFCEHIFDEFLAKLSLTDKQKGMEILDGLFENMRNVPPVTDQYRLPSSWRGARE